MTIFSITVTNHTFTARSEHELPSLEVARKQGMKAALAIGADEVSNGKTFFGAEVRVEDGDGNLGRAVVSVGASPLQ